MGPATARGSEPMWLSARKLRACRPAVTSAPRLQGGCGTYWVLDGTDFPQRTPFSRFSCDSVRQGAPTAEPRDLRGIAFTV